MKNYHDPKYHKNPDPPPMHTKVFGWKAWAFIIVIFVLAILCQLAG